MPRTDSKHVHRAKVRKKVTGIIFYYAFVVLSPLLLPFACLFNPIFIAIRLRDGKYLRHYATSVRAFSANAFYSIFVRKAFFRYIKFHLVYGQDFIERQVERRSGACERCARCCQMIKCPLIELDPQTKVWSCAAFDHGFWGELHCSIFPVVQQEIDLYQCKGFSFEIA